MIFSAQRKQPIICNAMDTTKEDGFLNDLAEIINLCVGYVSHKYKLSLSDIDIEKTVAEQKIIYDEVNMGFDDFCKNGLPKVIDKKALAFREVWVSKRREVMREIRNNLTDNIDKDFYISSVLAHFVGVHESIYSNLAIENLSRYEGADLMVLIALEKERTEKLVGFINGSFDFWSADETERTFRWACDEYREFMEDFDCLLLQSKINLLRYLNEQGMLQSYDRDEHKIISKIGPAAYNLLNEEIPKIEDESFEKDHFHCRFTDAQMKVVFHNLVSRGYLDYNTTLSDFLYVFTGRGKKPASKLNWIGTGTALALLIDAFYNEDVDEHRWNIAQKNFLRKGKDCNRLYLAQCFKKTKDIDKSNDNYRTLFQAFSIEDDINDID